MELKSTHKLDQFAGIDNVNLLTDMEQVNDQGHKYYFASAVNFDLTNKRDMRRRDGYRLLHDFGLPDVHSIWSFKDDCFFMVGDSLYRLNSNLTYTLLLGGFGISPMNYAEVYGKYYFTNTTEIGRIDSNGISAIPSPTDNFKVKMPAGHLMEWYNQCLYIAVGNIIYCSDPTFPGQYDYRHGLLPFNSRITMLKAVTDGLWVSDSENIYFLGGDTVLNFSTSHKQKVPVIERSAAVIDGRYLGTDSVGKSVLMLTTAGICIGSSGGNFLVPTADRYHGSKYFVAYDASVRISQDRYQYLVMGYDYQSGAAMDILAGFQVPSLSSEMNHRMSLPLLQVQFTATFT